MRWLIVPTMLLAALPLKDCGTVKVDGPKTKECPEGRYIVTADQTVSPPLVSYRCEKPAPEPTPTPACEPGDRWEPHGGPHGTSSCVPDHPIPSPSGAPSPSPTPRESPTPSPSASPSVSPCAAVLCGPGTHCMLQESFPPQPICIPDTKPSPTASPSTTNPIPVQLHVCPANYTRKPEHVKVGKNARRAPANPFAWLINLSPLVSDAAGLCQDENGHSRAGSDGMCEQWGACATQGLHDDANPLSSWEPAVYAEGPGFAWDHVESRSRPADPAEPPCPSDNKACYINYYLKNLVLGDGGSGPGHYFLCAAVTEAEVSNRQKIAATAECADFQLTLP